MAVLERVATLVRANLNDLIDRAEDPEKMRLTVEAEGAASSTRARGEAEADIIFRKGEAEAKAMNVKAEAFQEYNQAAIIDKLFTAMPEMIAALATPRRGRRPVCSRATRGLRGIREG